MDKSMINGIVIGGIAMVVLTVGGVTRYKALSGAAFADGDPFRRRIKKDVAGAVTYFVYSDEGLICEYDAAGTLQKAYGWKPDGTWGTDPLFMVENGLYYYYHNDQLGTPQKMTDPSGTVVCAADYKAFGEAVVNPASVVTSNLRFPGQYYDEETGLHYNWQRYYDPSTGRYVQSDPLGFYGGDVNLYRYANGNPIRSFDPLGLMSCKSACLADAAVNFGMGLIPGLKTIATLAQMGGLINLNFFQAAYGYGSFLDSGVTDVLSGAGNGVEWLARESYGGANGDVDYKRAKDLVNRNSFKGASPKRQGNLLRDAAKWSRLRAFARVTPIISHALNIADGISDVFECLGG